MHLLRSTILKCISLVVVAVFLCGCSDNTGKKLPEFTATTLSGKTINSKDLKGKIVVLKIWATWCGPCVLEIPSLNGVVDKYKNDSSIVFIAITDDTKGKIEHFLKDRPFAYQQIADAKNLKLLFQPGLRKEIPKHIIVDRDMNIVLDLSGGSENIAEIISTKIEQLK
ncbi:MAG TPA: TlpA disulfide reductase family protein [Cytophagaceae bacterium]|jgi:thiol-disulfide isomerase/thioredoxin|nr:TlpA disulfide reductase family protein [Cytophagaceae bacterium]